MQSGDNLIDKAVISLSEGAILGVTKELYLDPKLEYVVGIQLGSSEGFLHLGQRKFRVIERGNIAVFGVDAILLKEEADTSIMTDAEAPESESKEWLERSALKGRNINTPGGTRIGTLGDVIFDQEGWIVGFKFQQILVKGPIAAAQVIARDVILDLGHESGIMTIDLARAEKQTLSADQVGK